MTWAAAAAPYAMTALQTVQAVDALAGPQGALTTGDLSKGVTAGQKLSGGLSSMGVGGLGGPAGTASQAVAGALGVGSGATDTIEGALGISKLQFDALDPLTKQALLRKVMGR